MHARLISKNSSGFRISWFVVQRAQQKEVTRIEERVFVPWAATSKSAKRLKSIPGYYVSVFYSDAPANEHSNATSA